MQKRRGLNDFERFKVMKIRKQVRYSVYLCFRMRLFGPHVVYQMRLKNTLANKMQARFEVQKTFAKIRASAKA